MIVRREALFAALARLGLRDVKDAGQGLPWLDQALRYFCRFLPILGLEMTVGAYIRTGFLLIDGSVLDHSVQALRRGQRARR